MPGGEAWDWVPGQRGLGHGPHNSARFADQEASVHQRFASSHRTEKTEWTHSFLKNSLSSSALATKMPIMT